jgi:hypothetical protein
VFVLDEEVILLDYEVIWEILVNQVGQQFERASFNVAINLSGVNYIELIRLKAMVN